MRLIAGRHKGRSLQAPPGRSTRPTADRTRESLFNVLIHGLGVRFEGIAVLDVFAGSGALGLEALSRGAARATFVDLDRQALRVVRDNAATLGETERVLCLKMDATRLPVPPAAVAAPCALAFLDAPYGKGLSEPALRSLDQQGWLAPGAWVVVEMGAAESLAVGSEFERRDERTYGAARLLMLRRAGTETA
ncbi:16S rRNA (guanine(966)-N(2))-methyltransferase RsmD [Magnetospira thiophila]